MFLCDLIGLGCNTMDRCLPIGPRGATNVDSILDVHAMNTGAYQ
jgi:hypothetical protein